MRRSMLCMLVLLSLAVVLSGSASAQPGAAEARVRLALTDAGGASVPEAVRAHVYDTYGAIAALPADGDAPWTVTVRAGEAYDVWVDASDAEGLSSPLFRGVVLAAEAGDATAELTVPPSCTVAGRLLNADGTPLEAGCIVAVQSGALGAAPDDAAGYASGATGCYAQTLVGEGGAFTLQALTPGVHSLDVRRAGELRAFATVDEVKVTAGEVTDLREVTLPRTEWTYLFDGESLGDWAESGLFGQKPVTIDHDRIVLPAGGDMTGITWQSDPPVPAYEISLQAMRFDGHDFFCGLTFPTKDDACCSLILGGWGGSLVGISSIDGADASENETSTSVNFEERHWYRVRVRVTTEDIQAWLDERPIIDVGIANRKIDIRWEMERCKPFGVATWRTTGALRDIRVREL